MYQCFSICVCIVLLSVLAYTKLAHIHSSFGSYLLSFSYSSFLSVTFCRFWVSTLFSLQWHVVSWFSGSESLCYSFSFMVFLRFCWNYLKILDSYWRAFWWSEFVLNFLKLFKGVIGSFNIKTYNDLFFVFIWVIIIIKLLMLVTLIAMYDELVTNYEVAHYPLLFSSASRC
jgi:hypothetical protein